MGWYTAHNNDKVAKLVLYAPPWLGTSRRSLTAGRGQAGRLPQVTGEAQGGLARGRSRGQEGGLSSPRAGSRPGRRARSPAILRRRRELHRCVRAQLAWCIADGREYWSPGKPLHDPGDPRPGLPRPWEWDAGPAELSMLYGYFAKLTTRPTGAMSKSATATHTVMIEKNRMQLFEAVQQFLDEDLKPAQ